MTFTPTNLAWHVQSTSGTVSISNPISNSATGTGTFDYTVAPNTGASARGVTLLLEDSSSYVLSGFVVNQDAPFSLTLDPSSITKANPYNLLELILDVKGANGYSAISLSTSFSNSTLASYFGPIGPNPVSPDANGNAAAALQAADVYEVAPGVYPISISATGTPRAGGATVTVTLTVNVTVYPKPGFVISPGNAVSIKPGSSGLQFTATVDGTPSSQVTWSIVVPSGQTCQGGTGIINASTGQYAPPA